VRAQVLKIGTRAQQRGIAAIVIACLIVGIAAAPAVSAAATRNRGYWIAGQNEQVFAFGDASTYSRIDLRLVRGQIVDMAAHPGGMGYWLLGQDGAVYPYGDARDFGQGGLSDQSAVAIASTPTGNGYYVVSDKGGVKAFGDAVSRGSLDKKDLKEKIVDIAVTPSGNGYWLVDESGHMNVFGDAGLFGSLDGKKIVGMASTPSGNGYWLVDDSGEVWTFGGAFVLGSLDDPAKKIVDITPTHSGRGYWIVDRDGLVFAFGDAVHYGELAKKDLRSGQIVAIVSTPFVNRVPVANTDTVALDEDTTIDVDVLANDTDEDGDPLTAVVLTQPAHGTATLNANGTVRYAPAQDYNGPDSFTYRVSDPFGGSAVGTVRITVRPVNDAPVATDDAFTTDEDTALSGTLVANDTDVDGDSLTAVIAGLPAHGGVLLGLGGTFVYTPSPDFNGDDSFTYRASDGSLTSNIATVRIHVNPVNDAPVAVADTNSLDEDTTLTVEPPGVLANDTDVDGDALHAVLAGGASHGTLTLSPNGGYTYTPNANYNGSDAFTYQANDGALDSGNVSVTLTIRPVNDDPVARPDTYDSTEDTALVVGAPGVLANDTDVDGDTLTAEVVTPPAHGTLTLMPDGSFSYVPAANFNGTDVFVYRARDGVSASPTTSVTIRVAAVNDAPDTTDDEYSLDEDTTLTVDAPGVLGNDSDVDGPTVTATLGTGPSHGDITFASDGSFDYTPDPDFFGTETFTYVATDGLLPSRETTVIISVHGVNDAPVPQPDAYTTAEDAALVIGANGVLSNDADADGDTLVASLAVGPEHGSVVLFPDGTFEYMPDPNFNGTDGFTYNVSDGQELVLGTAVTITVTPVDDPPSAADDSYETSVGATLSIAAPGVLANDFDDSETLGAVLVASPTHGTLSFNANGSFTYTTNLTAAGTDSFTYKVTDGVTESAPATVHITVNATPGGGGGGSGTFGSWAQPTLVVWDFDTLRLAGSGNMKTPRGQIKNGVYMPDRGQRGRDSFNFGGRHYEIDIISDIWGD
jgi:VCBS repeat-containing protein